MNNTPTPETDAVAEKINFGVDIDFARKLERDEALEKIEQQRKEIVRLNGATSHAGGTPLKIALRERDEAREKYDTLAVENMLTINKLCKERDEARLEAAMWALQRDEAREAAAKWEAVALREASINGARICAKKGAK